MSEIQMRNRNREVVAVARVDEEDFAELMLHRWSLSHGRAQRVVRIDGRKRTVLMHRQIMGCTFGDGVQVDHIDRDTLNNRRSNLRIVTQAENKQNLSPAGYAGSTSRFRGVSWDTRRQCWVASIKLNGKRKGLGEFAREEDAAAVASAARARHMPFSADARAAA